MDLDALKRIAMRSRAKSLVLEGLSLVLDPGELLREVLSELDDVDVSLPPPEPVVKVHERGGGSTQQIVLDILRELGSARGSEIGARAAACGKTQGAISGCLWNMRNKGIVEFDPVLKTYSLSEEPDPEEPDPKPSERESESEDVDDEEEPGEISPDEHPAGPSLRLGSLRSEHWLDPDPKDAVAGRLQGRMGVVLHLPILRNRPAEPPPGVDRVAWRSKRFHAVRAKTENVGRLSKRQLQADGELYPEETSLARPRTRADCVDGARPCPFVSCRHHLYLDVLPNGSLKRNFPNLEPEELSHSCSLDLADGGSQRLEDVGAVMNLTRERIRMIEVEALGKLRSRALYLRDGESEDNESKDRSPRAEVRRFDNRR